MRRWLAFVLLAGLVLRVAGIGFGLPAAFNADEPHLVNVAVSFGSGSLNPHFFKYPTLWMYTLFAAYGVYFVLWSGLGLLHTVRQFGEMFVWNSTGFYLIARLLSAAFSLAALERAYRTASLLQGEEAGLWAAASLAASPILITAAHAAKPDSLMLFLSAWAWWFAARYWIGGRGRDLVFCGFAVGLASSAQYTALPLGILVPAAGWARRGLKERAVWPACAAVAAGFVAGSPFAALDFSHFRQMLQDQRALEAMPENPDKWKTVIKNVLTFGGPVVPGGLAWLAGAAYLCWKDRAKAAFLLAPALVFWGLLSRSGEGGWQRYLFAVFPGLAVTAAVGADAALRRLAGGWPRRARLAAALAAFMVPGAAGCVAFDRELTLPDTRWEATRWIEANIPQGTKVLLDQEHASPQLRMEPAEVEELLARTRAAGHPRWRYYDFMRTGHPGGGYRIYRVLRDPSDLHTNPAIARISAEGRPTLDVRSGLGAARAAGIEIVALTSQGAGPERSPELADFLRETRGEGKLLAAFDPEPGRRTGPSIRIYRIVP